MSTKNVYNLIVLDESGSMESIKDVTIDGFNEVVQTVQGIEKQFPEQKHFISLVTFNGLEIKTVLHKKPVSKLRQIDKRRYQPQASTPLFDAIGYSVSRLKAELEGDNNQVLVTILTDGCENSSREYNHLQIKNLIEKRKAEGWTFTYIGTDHDVESVAFSLSVENTIRFSKDEAHMKQMFNREKSARQRYSDKLRKGENVSADFYIE